MASAPARTAFQLIPAVEHKSQKSVVSTVALDGSGQHLYVGTSDGQFEEHRITSTVNDTRVVLGARRHIGKKAVAAICHLSAASRVAALIDGIVMLLDDQTLEGHALPGIKGVSAMGVNATGEALAVATRASKKAVRVLLYTIVPGSAAASSLTATALCFAQAEIAETLLVKSVSFLGRRLILCTARRYMLLEPRTGSYVELFGLPEDSPSPTAVIPIPPAAQAILVMDQVGIVVDGDGNPTQSALTFPASPLCIAACGFFVLCAGPAGVHVLDRVGGDEVQWLPYPDGLHPSPGQKVTAATSASSNCVVLAGFRKVWMYRPVALEQQARQLLQAGQFDQALQLANTCSLAGAPWAETAFAEAGFLLLQELRFTDAMQTLQRCSTSLFQPMELFPMFPAETGAWKADLPAKLYWGLHGPLTPLAKLLEAHPSLQEAPDDDLAARLQDDAKRAVADYLLQVRSGEGVEARDGIDTLIVLLLADLDRAAELEHFCGSPTSVAVDQVEGPLRARERFLPLAALYAGAGHSSQALSIWQGLADGSLVESQADTSGAGPSHEDNRSLALRQAAALLQDEARVDATTALQCLAWLIAASPELALALLEARELPEEQVLDLLRGLSRPLLLAYLQHLVSVRGTSSADLHTELALVLGQAALDLLPESNSAPCAQSDLNPDGDAAEGRSLPHAAAAAEGGAGLLLQHRSSLQTLLETSDLYRVGPVLGQIRGTQLWQEQVILLRKVGDHLAALRILALVVGDMDAAEDYCGKHAGPDGYLTLLDMLLRPGDARPPLFMEACHLLAAQGANLDPMHVLESLGEEMPLGLAFPTLARIQRERLHRRRHTSVIRSLSRSVGLAAATTRAQVMACRVVASEERACRICHSRVGSKMFAVYPNGVLACFKCFRTCDPSQCPITGRQFDELPSTAGEQWADLHASS